ncbi:hypothetical protein BJ138DRAFT_1138224 [Hygrophoropsis aurantiaca]|uniref:Uncharacterized protein n=1 Tax=Hygrophoropsis aurantiaca TaxID=72124 RepID=A0ACB7ZXD5_9AGAM|nr:hypothetical protein BJ138DRAFT_1138224 [Hygrophoropsis aurantiaca]
MIEIRRLGEIHGIHVKTRLDDDGLRQVVDLFESHGSGQACCINTATVLQKVTRVRQNHKKNISSVEKLPQFAGGSSKIVDDQKPSGKIDFPPSAPSDRLRKKIIRQFCEDSSPTRLEEAGCAVCGSLTRLEQSELIGALDEACLKLLVPKISGITRQTRLLPGDPIRDIEGPVLDGMCSHVCTKCLDVLRRGRTPTLALANGIWLGSVPEELQGLNYVEKLLVARVRHNRCIIRVSSSGMHKMIANVISFQHPSHKIYKFLPPPLEDLEEMLACVFTGPCAPTAEDFKRTPLLVRRNKVARALEWLKLNHVDYAKLGIAYDELDRYPESGPPVSIEYHYSDTNKRPEATKYHYSDTNKRPEATSVHDMEENDGNEKGPCPFTVHALKALKALAVRHLMEGGKVLAIGHNEVPESIFDNPQLYPQMFPWLFPYGLGGIGQRHFKSKLSGSRHKRHLLLFHDKRFQVDEHFPLVAFNHEQIKSSTSSGFILTNKLFSIDVNVLQTISTRLKEGTSLPAQSEEESACYQVIRDLDHVGSGNRWCSAHTDWKEIF